MIVCETYDTPPETGMLQCDASSGPIRIISAAYVRTDPAVCVGERLKGRKQFEYCTLPTHAKKCRMQNVEMDLVHSRRCLR